MASRFQVKYLEIIAVLEEELVLIAHRSPLLLSPLPGSDTFLHLLSIPIGHGFQLNAADDPPGRSPGANHIVVGHGEKVSIFLERGSWSSVTAFMEEAGW